jgi:VanZ family protein
MSSTGRSSEVLIDVVLWAAALVCAGLTLWWSLVSLPPERRLFEGVDKLQHGLAYLVTSLLLFLAAVWRPGRGDGPFARWGVWVVAALIAAGAGIEVLQSFIGRDAELGDWVAEIVAVGLSWGAVAALRAWSRRRADPPKAGPPPPARA